MKKQVLCSERDRALLNIDKPCIVILFSIGRDAGSDAVCSN